ncbi:MAG TPA: preprotein translocase subunit SecY [Lentisphaeria bacterium]|nr:MAG: preprotein translocase subunit SecY [Lentisphaerae bacterium GWF2_38_69]HBM16295.1 preprotein translocase subunit SecY [Lentisphaeria bacterium]
MFSAFLNAFKIKEVRDKILFTLGIIALCRVMSNIPCPGVDTHALNIYFNQFSQNGSTAAFFGLFDMFTGGAIHKFAIATLGIMPYISASIIMQMLQPVVPQFEKMVREGGDAGRQKFNQYTRFLTLIICVIQGAMAAYAMQRPQTIGLPVPTSPLVMTTGPSFVIMTVIILTCGSMILMWLGEKITDNGIGNGASIIITIGIVSRMPSAIFSLYELVIGGSSGTSIRPVHLFLLALLFILVTAATVILTQGQRKIPIQYAKKTVGKRMLGGNSFIPLRVNFSGVMPIILAGSILIVPEMIFRWIPATRWLAAYFNYGSSSYMLIYGLMILFFSFFWVANQFNPVQISENLKRDSAFIPGIRPGKPTADYLDSTMTKVTLAGSIFLMALAVFPMLLNQHLNLPYIIDSFFGGTSLLIMVGVTLDSLSQLESHLITRNYDGFLKNGKILNRRNYR